ncbi:MAG: rubrerythrin family protein [Deltaproteobacteria bacterium]|nr:rubrerythrin family protein [Deltaproteobacteria bacterium]MBN2674605.1 rubrerythrin family protein [Deltaproteobacteria bacterium]
MSNQKNQSEENLYKAFVGEATASLRLKGYAEKAEKEGYPQMAKLFRAISAAEEIHALKHLRILRIIKSTQENLQDSFESETRISEGVYPDFLRVAIDEGHKAAEVSFSQARDAEEVHGKLYKNAIDHMLDETETDYYVCPVCGYVHAGEPTEDCPVCNVGPDKFLKVA